MHPDNAVRYRAFISYSRKDLVWGRWLHRRLETYRLPRAVAAQAGAPRLHPCFFDREELSASRSLPEALREHLDASATLVVVCSPAAAQSRFVNEEIRYFQATHPERSVLAFIIAGEPNASEMPGRAKEECFPDALRWDRSDPDARPRPAPLAADARPWADGKWAAFLKTVAGVAAIPYAELSRRDLKRRRIKLVLRTVVVGAVILAGAWAVCTWWQHEARIRVKRTRDAVALLTGVSPLDLMEGHPLPDGGMVLLRRWGVEIREGDTGAFRMMVPLENPSLLEVPGRVGEPLLLAFEQRDRGAFGLAGNTSRPYVLRLDPVKGSPTVLVGLNANERTRFFSGGEGRIIALQPPGFWQRSAQVQWFDAQGRGQGRASLPEAILEGGAWFDGTFLGLGTHSAWRVLPGAKPVALPLPPVCRASPQGQPAQGGDPWDEPRIQWLALHAWGGILRRQNDPDPLLVRRTAEGWQTEPVRVPGGEEMLRRRLRTDRFWVLMDPAGGTLRVLDRRTGAFGAAIAIGTEGHLEDALREGVTRVAPDGQRIWVVLLSAGQGCAWRIEVGTPGRIQKVPIPPAELRELGMASLAGEQDSMLYEAPQAERFGSQPGGAGTLLKPCPNDEAFSDLTLVEMEQGRSLWIASRDRMVRLRVVERK